MPRPRGRPRDTPAQRLNRKRLREQRRKHRQFVKKYLRNVAKEAEDLPRRSLRLEWLEDNKALIAAGQGPAYTLVLFGEPGFDLVNPPLDGYHIIAWV